MALAEMFNYLRVFCLADRQAEEIFVQKFGVDFLNICNHLVEVEMAPGQLPGISPQSISLCGMLQQIREMVRQFLNVSGFVEQAGLSVVNNFRDAIDARHNDRLAQKHGFRHGPSQPLPQRGRGKDVSRPQNIRDVIAETEHPNTLL